MVLLFDTKSFQNYEKLFIKLLERKRNYLCIKKFIKVEEFKMNSPDLFLVDIYKNKNWFTIKIRIWTRLLKTKIKLIDFLFYMT